MPQNFSSRVSRFARQTLPATEPDTEETSEQTAGDTLDQQDAAAVRGGVTAPQASQPEPEAETLSDPTDKKEEASRKRGRRPMTEEEKAAAKAAREAKKQSSASKAVSPAKNVEPLNSKVDVKTAIKAVEQELSDEIARHQVAVKELRAKHLELSARLFDLAAFH